MSVVSNSRHDPKGPGCIRHFLGARAVFLPSRGPSPVAYWVVPAILWRRRDLNAAPHRKVEDHAHAWERPREPGISTLASIAGSVGRRSLSLPQFQTFRFNASLAFAFTKAARGRSASTEIRMCATLNCIWFTKTLSAALRAPTTRGTQRTAGEFISSADASFRPPSFATDRTARCNILGSHQPPGMLAVRGDRRFARRDAIRACLACAAQTPANAEEIEVSPASPKELATSLEHPNGSGARMPCAYWSKSVV